MSGWRPALRIARRTIRHDVGRSLLIATLVGVPVAGATVVDVVYRSTDGPEHDAYLQMGEADALAIVTAAESLDGWAPEPWAWPEPPGAPERDPRDVDLADILPAGSRAVPDPGRSSARIAKGEGFIEAPTVVAALDDPLYSHVARLTQGDSPAAADEVAVTPPLAEKLDLLTGGDLEEGATVDIIDGPALSVTALAVDPMCLSCESMFGTPGSDLAASLRAENSDAAPEGGSASAEAGNLRYLVDLPKGADTDQVVADLANSGIGLIPRGVFLTDSAADPPITVDDLQAIALIALIVGLGLVEIVLLAGAAFAVGAKRQTRDLGLVAVNGATPTQVRRVVLAQGLALGTLGALLGLVVGWLTVIAGGSLLERLLGRLVDEWRFGTGEMALAAAVGVLSGLAAAVVPAVGASRMKPVDALAGRFRATTLDARIPVIGVVLVAVGAVLALVGNRLMAAAFAEHRARLDELPDGTGVQAPSVELHVTLELVGALMAVAGVVIATPALVSLLARRARRLGFSVRYAVRDAGRHRHRTAPTVAAIMIVVAGSVGISMIAAGSDRANAAEYVPNLPDGVMSITTSQPGDAASPDQLDAAIQAAREKLPDSTPIYVTTPYAEFTYGDPDPPATDDLEAAELMPLELVTPEENVSCVDGDCYIVPGPVAVATPELFELITGRPMTDDEHAAIAAGEMLVFDKKFVAGDGTATLGSPDFELSNTEPRSFRALFVEPKGDFYSLPAGLVPESAFPRDDWAMGSEALLDFGDAAEDDVDAAIMATELQGAYGWVDEGPGSNDPMMLVVTAVSAFVTLVGTAIAISLAAAESRADFATMAAVGAQPRRRRVVAAAQALVIAGLGTLLGLGVGGFFAFAAWPSTGSADIVLPWTPLALTVLAVPMLAVIVATIVTPSRLPLIRRLD